MKTRIKLHLIIYIAFAYNRENETYNFLKRNVQFSLFFTPSKQRHLITI